MRILFDHQIFSFQIYGGISRYFCELFKQFDNDKTVECELGIKFSNNYYLPESKKGKVRPFFAGFSFKGKHRLLNFLNKKMSTKSILRKKYDVFHPTYYDPYFLSSLNGKPFVLTIYDMVHERYPDMFTMKDRTFEGKKILAKKAQKIIAISHSTKRDIIKFMGVDADRIEVIHLAASFGMVKNSNDCDLRLPERFLLFVGKRESYKNFDRFIRATATLLFRHTNLNIVCAGGGKFTAFEMLQIENLKLEKRVFQIPVADDHILSLLYKKAIAFVFPSLCEGFGIPVLEAFACGCPVITSNVSSLPEVAGNAAAYFDPIDISSISEAMGKVIADKKLRDTLRTKGYQRLRDFSWEKTAQKTKLVYESIL
ncbi:MAG: glycosyltransferase family 1 protein [Candidatus Omnitrophota bacterium]